jgi:hypothetical protein
MMTRSQTQSGDLLDQFARAAERFAAAGTGPDAISSVIHAAVTLIPAAEYASISLGRDGQFWTVAATDGAARAADAVQYSLGRGPCVDAALDDTVYRTGDIPSDPRWPGFGPAVFEETGALSMLAFRLFIECENDLVAALNLYSNQRDAFDDATELAGQLLAVRAAAAVSQSRAGEKHDALRRTWMSLATISAAVRVLTDTYRITADEAFDVLQVSSQYCNRNLGDVAAGVAENRTLVLGRSGDLTAVRIPAPTVDPFG